MSDVERRATAMLQEFSIQRGLLGDRAANLAADKAELLAEIAALKARIAELEKQKDA